MKNTLLIFKITLIQLLFLAPLSLQSQCSINEIWADITACEEQLFDITLNFNRVNTSDQFTLVGNGTNYGTFNYADLPITLTSLAADCVTEYEFVITDVADNDCSNFLEWGVVCCDQECELSDLVLTPSECENGDFQLTIDFDYQGNTSSFFNWAVVGVTSGSANFADLPSPRSTGGWRL